MILMLEVTYPGTKLADVANMFTQYTADNPFPDCVKLDYSYAVAGGDGIEVRLFYNIDDARSKEGTDYVAKGVLYHLAKVEGYKGSSKIVYPLMEAYSLVDLTPPAV